MVPHDTEAGTGSRAVFGIGDFWRTDRNFDVVIPRGLLQRVMVFQEAVGGLIFCHLV
jgi:hypothetical protein